MAKRTEKIAFDFSLWGQEGISVYHNDGRKAVYVGETVDKILKYMAHWDNKSITWFDGKSDPNVTICSIYMTRETEVPTLEEVMMQVAKQVFNETEFPPPPDEKAIEYAKLFLKCAKEIGIDNLLNPEK